jgi:septum formation protein
MPLWLGSKPLVLASASRVRQLLLRNAGIDVEVCPAAIDERAVEAASPSPDPGTVALLLAREKATLFCYPSNFIFQEVLYASL